MTNTTITPKKDTLYYIEKAGNALPHPALLFAIFAFSVLILSAVGSFFGWHGEHDVIGRVEVNNLLTREGIHNIILNTVTNYTSFAPLGVVMVAMLGIGVAEQSGLIRTAINAMLVKTPARLITFMVVFTAIVSNVAGDLGYLLIIPLAGVIFHSLGRHPLVGMSAAFAGVSGGFSANIFINSLDPLLAGITQESARLVDPTYVVLPTANYFFMAVSTFLIAILGTVVAVRWTEPRFGKYTGNVEREAIVQPTALEKKGLRNAGWTFLAWTVLLVILLLPAQIGSFTNPLGDGFLLGDAVVNGTEQSLVERLLNSPVLRGIVPILLFITASLGVAYGFTVGTYKKAADVITSMSDSFKSLAAYLVLVFFASQFVAWLRWSDLGLILAINGAESLRNMGVTLIPLMIMFVIFTGLSNFMMGSASAKWAIMGPVFVPIFMFLGYSPELAQAVYRVGDSVTNVISPMMSFFPLIIVYYQKYDKNAGIGTIVAAMLPYTIAFFLGWTALLIVWVTFGLPLGPGVSMFYYGL
jgi:aminobenzoyl-glutamate transport protein